MKAFAVLGILIGIMAMFMTNISTNNSESERIQAVALNYAIYRSAAFAYVLNNRSTVNGEIAQNALMLPQGWQALRPWRTYVEAGNCYIFGQASASEINATRAIFQNSLAIGRAAQGKLLPNGKTVIPSFVPNNSLVSVIALE